MSLAWLAILPYLPVAAQESKSTENIRIQYDRTDAVPDEVFLPAFFDHLLQMEKNAPRYTAMMRKEYQRTMTLSSMDEDQDYFSYLMQKAKESQAEYRQAFRRSICPLDTPRPTGQAVLVALNDLDDSKSAIGRHYLTDIHSALGDEHYEKFLAWINSKKSSFRIVIYDHTKVYAGKDPDLVRQRACGSFDSAMLDREGPQ